MFSDSATLPVGTHDDHTSDMSGDDVVIVPSSHHHVYDALEEKQFRHQVFCPTGDVWLGVVTNRDPRERFTIRLEHLCDSVMKIVNRFLESVSCAFLRQRPRSEAGGSARAEQTETETETEKEGATSRQQQHTGSTMRMRPVSARW